MGEAVSEPALEDVVDTQAMAEMIIYEMIGRRATWPLKRVVEVYPIARDLNLTGRPVREVESVTDHRGQTVEGWELHSGFRVRLPQSLVGVGGYFVRPSDGEYYGNIARACSPREVTVTYVYGHAEPPEIVRRAIDIYKEQLDLAIEGDSACQLPKRVTSISRQGISMTIIDPAEYLDKGRTGLPQVDSLISFVNPTAAKRRARLFTDKNPPPRRLSIETVQEES